MKLACLQICLLSVLMGLAGCGRSGPPKYPVSGTVTYKGTPVTEGMVTFYSSSGGGIVSFLDASGGFVIEKGLVEGQYRVFIEPPQTIKKPPPPGGPPMDPPKSFPNVPEKYRQASTSGLVATVEADASGNTFEFDMQ